MMIRKVMERIIGQVVIRKVMQRIIGQVVIRKVTEREQAYAMLKTPLRLC